MTDHRGVQRALFRMQADAEFAARVLARDAQAVASTGLSREDLELFHGVEPAALAADPGGRRRTQIAGNAASEFTLTLACAARTPLARDFLDDFLSSTEFHAALRSDGRLPLAFGDYAERRAREAGALALGAVARLELAMAKLRRDARVGAGDGTQLHTGKPGTIRLSARARVVELPAGTLELASLLQAAVDANTPAPDGALSGNAEETVLLVAEPASVHRLGDVRPELLQPPVDELFSRAREPLDRAARAAFARAQGAAPEDLESFLEAYLAEGVLVRGA